MKYILPLFLFACEDVIKSTTACDDYIDYICDCHSDNPDYDCNAMSNIYADPTTEQESECSVSLDEQMALDAEDEFECEL
ncbi:MAG: hypothetical protein VX278_01695 [Myxococcota bacterium]|nr:hypothetical protein [Myxococcota bacterium]